MPASGPEVYVGTAPMEPPRNGLLASAAVVDRADDRFIGGISFDLPDRGALELWDFCSQDAVTPVPLQAGGTGGVTNTGGVPTSSPSATFGLMARDECSGFGWEGRDYVERARLGIRVHESWAVERILADNPTGMAKVPYLSNAASPSLTYPAGAATLVDPAKAIALADHAIAQANIGRGMIHVPAYLLTLAAGKQVILPDGSTRWVTPNGNIVVGGNGYTGKGPGGVNGIPTDGTAGSAWIYATELITLHRQAEVQVIPGSLAEAMVRDTNSIRYRAERAYAIEWGRMLHAAIQVPVQHTTAF